MTKIKTQDIKEMTTEEKIKAYCPTFYPYYRANFVQSVPNSQSFNRLEQIATNLELGLMTNEDIIIGIRNSIEMGYEMKKSKKKKKK